MELLTKIDNKPEIPLMLLNQVCSTSIDHVNNWKIYEKINVLLIGGHGAGKSTLLNFIEQNFADNINIIREGKFSTKGYLVNTLTVKAQDANEVWQFYPKYKIENNEILISQIPEVGQNTNMDSYDTLKQLHDGRLVHSTEKTGLIDIGTDNVYLTACANKLDFQDEDSQAVLNRYIILILPNDRELSLGKVFNQHEDLTAEELSFIKEKIQRCLDLLQEPLSKEMIESIKPFALKYQQDLPDLDVLDGCRPYTQFISLVHINMFLLNLSLEESCKFVSKFLIDNHIQLYQFLLKGKSLVEPDWREKTYNFLRNVIYVDTKFVSTKYLCKKLAEFYQIKEASVSRRKIQPLIELNWLKELSTPEGKFYQLINGKGK